MSYDPRYTKVKIPGAKILLIILCMFYTGCIIAVVWVWLAHKRDIEETEKALLETKKQTDTVLSKHLDTVSEFGGEKIGELVDHMVKSARPDDEEKACEEAEAAARRARERKISELKQRKKQLDSKIAAADSRHRAATRTVPMTPVFETSDSDATRRISAQQTALKEKLRNDADNAGQELRKLQIERQHIIHQISKLEKE